MARVWEVPAHDCELSKWPLELEGRRRRNPVSPSRSPLVTSLSFTRSCHHLPVPPQAGDQTNLHAWAFEGHFTSPACHLSSPLQSVQQSGFQDIHRIVQPSLADVLQQFYYPPHKPMFLQLLQCLVIAFWLWICKIWEASVSGIMCCMTFYPQFLLLGVFSCSSCKWTVSDMKILLSGWIIF